MTTTVDELARDLAVAGAEHTIREISQQPAAWREVARLVAERRPEIDDFLQPLLDRRDLRIVLTGAGTSAFAGDILATQLARHLDRRVEAIATTDLLAHPADHLREQVPTLLVSFARSGDSPESVAVTGLADRLLPDCHHLVVTCNPDGELHRVHESQGRSLVLLMPAMTNDRGFAMTSSFTSMLLASLLCFRLPLGASPEQLAAAGEQLLAAFGPATAALAGTEFGRVVYLGSGPLRGLARESALKMLELTAGAVPTWFESSLGFRHGPKAVLDDDTVVFVFVANDPYARRYDVDMVDELALSLPRERVIAVTGQAAGLDAATVWQVAGAAELTDVALPLLFVVLAQLFAVHTSARRGRTPDDPFPSRLVNRVVQGVDVHPFPAAP